MRRVHFVKCGDDSRLPITDPERTLAVDSWDRGRSRGQGVSYLDYRDWRENTKTFETFGAYSGSLANLSDEGQPPERYNGSYLSANAFSILGMRPVIGRDFVRRRFGAALHRWR